MGPRASPFSQAQRRWPAGRVHAARKSAVSSWAALGSLRPGPRCGLGEAGAVECPVGQLLQAQVPVTAGGTLRRFTCALPDVRAGSRQTPLGRAVSLLGPGGSSDLGTH